MNKPVAITVEKFAEIAKGIIDTDRDCIIGISGKTGEGKSTLSIQIGKAVDPKFSADRNMTFSRKETSEKIRTLPKKSCPIVDEAVNVLFRRDFMKGEQKELLKFMDMNRDRNHVLLMNVPNFWSLDSHTQDRVRMWIYVQKRGLAMIFQPSKNPFSRDPWNRRHNEKLSFRGKLLRSKNFTGFLNFDKLSDSEAKEYLKVKEEKKEKLKEEVRPDLLDYATFKRCMERGMVQFIYQLKEKGYLACGLKEIAEMRGLSLSHFRHTSTRSSLRLDKLLEPILYKNKKVVGENKNGQD